MIEFVEHLKAYYEDENRKRQLIDFLFANCLDTYFLEFSNSFNYDEYEEWIERNSRSLLVNELFDEVDND